ncbi:hypothetical protein FRC07_002808 [Ceratobasidium sp. 392]|nr:hypothetical protein FRC07_002808 [Ceratobasidium sp. 392]
MLISVPASVVDLVNPSLSERNGSLVWSFQQHEPVAAMDFLWDKLSKSRHNIPPCSRVDNFPHRSQNFEDQLVHHDASEAMEAMPTGMDSGLCYLCGQIIPIQYYMRTHVAKRILSQRLGYSDSFRNTVGSQNGVWVLQKSAFDYTVNNRLFEISADKVTNLKLENMWIVPGRNPITIRPASAAECKRLHEDLTSTGRLALSQGAEVGDDVDASSSSSKRSRFG